MEKNECKQKLRFSGSYCMECNRPLAW